MPRKTKGTRQKRMLTVRCQQAFNAEGTRQDDAGHDILLTLHFLIIPSSRALKWGAGTESVHAVRAFGGGLWMDFGCLGQLANGFGQLLDRI